MEKANIKSMLIDLTMASLLFFGLGGDQLLDHFKLKCFSSSIKDGESYDKEEYE
jgi:hypothetical protein